MIAFVRRIGLWVTVIKSTNINTAKTTSVYVTRIIHVAKKTAAEVDVRPGNTKRTQTQANWVVYPVENEYSLIIRVIERCRPATIRSRNGNRKTALVSRRTGLKAATNATELAKSYAAVEVVSPRKTIPVLMIRAKRRKTTGRPRSALRRTSGSARTASPIGPSTSTARPTTRGPISRAVDACRSASATRCSFSSRCSSLACWSERCTTEPTWTSSSRTGGWPSSGCLSASTSSS